MGNRAVITTGEKPDSEAIYLHWNGGPESVFAFLAAAKDYGVRGADDPQYCIARLAQIIGNFFGGTLSIGVSVLSNMDVDNYDNGTYLIDSKLDIIKRFGEGSDNIMSVEHLSLEEKESYTEMLHEIKKRNDPLFIKK